MESYRVLIVDAFTTVPYAGNPCGVITRAAGLDEARMQAIARELNLSETAFVFPSSVADFGVRFFTPTREIPLAGHPTIATMHALAEEGRIDLSSGRSRVTQEIAPGVLPVDLARKDDGLTQITMTQAPPVFGPLLEPAADWAAALGIEVDDLLAGFPPQAVSTGTVQAMVPVRSIDVLRRLRPNPPRLGRLETAAGCFGTHVFALEGLHPGSRTHARHVAGNAGFAEDPFTGSATGGMAAFLWRSGLVREARFTAEQGHLIGRPGMATVEIDGDGDTPVAVRVGGTAVTVLRGEIVA